MARSNVQESELVGARFVIGDRGGDRIAGIAQIDEVDAFDDAAVFDVEAGNHADLEHLGRRLSLMQERERRRRVKPAVVKRAAGNCAFELLRARLEQRPHIGERSKPP